MIFCGFFSIAIQAQCIIELNLGNLRDLCIMLCSIVMISLALVSQRLCVVGEVSHFL